MSPFTREHYIDEIINALSYLKSRVKLDNAITKYTINIEAETFYAGFLNVVYGFRLKNANHSKKNFPSIDLYEESKGDDGQRVAVQVTSDNSSDKIKKTLKSFCQNGYQKDYTRLIILIITDKKPYGSVFAFPEGTGIQFDQSRDILDTDDLIKYIRSIDNTAHIQRIYEFLKKELPPVILGIHAKENPDHPGNREKELYDNLMQIFSNDRKTHPCIHMMKPEFSMFPKGFPEIFSNRRYAVDDKKEVRAIKDIILESWNHDDKKHILFIGESGIGKTVAMLTLPEEEWFKAYKIPVIYVPLRRLGPYEGDLDLYLSGKLGGDYYHIIELANRYPKDHPCMLLLLDGFNEIPYKYKEIASKCIRIWMEKPGIQIITTSTLGFSLENHFSKYRIQPLSYDTTRFCLLSSGIKEEQLLGENNQLWRVINTPLMLIMYVRIVKLKEEANNSPLAPILEWKDQDNAAHLIWNFLQTELYHCIKKNYSVYKHAIALLVIVPYICCQMSFLKKYNIKQEIFDKIIHEALVFYASHPELMDNQILNIIGKSGPYYMQDLFQEANASEYGKILIENLAVFQKQEFLGTESENEQVISYSFSLIYKNCRDILAAFFVCSCLLNMSESKEKKALLKYTNFYVKNYMADHYSDSELVNVWTRHREEEPEDGQITYFLLDLLGRQRNYDYREVNFSGVDLTKTNLHRLLSRRLDICPLPVNRNQFVGTKISINSFLPNGNIGGVNSVAYSPDGRSIASGTIDKHVWIWDPQVKEYHILAGHTGQVNTVAYSPDGTHLASGASDKTVRIWDLQSGQYRVLEVNAGVVNSVAFSPDGMHLAIGASDKTVRIWDLQSDEYWTLALNASVVNSVAYSPDGGHLAIGASDSTVKIWNLQNGNLQVLEGHTDSVNSIAYSPNGRHLASGADDSTVRIWNLESGECRVLQGHSGEVYSITYSPDGKQLASGSNDSKVRIWNLQSGECLVFEGHTGRVKCVAFSPNEWFLVSGADDMTIRIWTLEEKKEVEKSAVLSHFNLSGANFEMAVINEKDIELLRAAGAILQNNIHHDNINPYYSSELLNLINKYFEQKPENYLRIDTFIDFLHKNRVDDMQRFLSNGLQYLFYISETDNKLDALHIDDTVLQQLIYQIWMIDNSLLNETETVLKPLAMSLNTDVTKPENIPSEDSQVRQDQSKGHKNDTPQKDLKPDSSAPDKVDLEEATLLVVTNFQKWLIKRLKEDGTEYDIIQQAYRQSSGEQYGYDVGLVLKIGKATYKLSFECKDYTSNIKENGKNTNINARAYAINLVKYFINCNTDINNRWVLINPFGNLQNDYPEKLFENWNRHHSYMRIFAITEDQSYPTCSDFFSVDEKAYQKVYPNKKLPSDMDDKRETLFSYIFETIIGEDYISMDIKKKLKRYSLPNKFMCTQPSDLLSERTKNKTKDRPVALNEVLRYLTEINNTTKSRSKNGIYIIGEYGTGKTWLLYQTIVEIIHHSAKYPFIPVYMGLKEFFAGFNDLNIINIETCNIRPTAELYVERVLDQQNLLDEYSMQFTSPVFLIDGFDEVLSGLSATNNKIKILLSIRDILQSMYRNNNPIFIVTSRESDFHACQTNKEFIELFGEFYKITLEDCPLNEVKKKLLNYSEHIDNCEESIESLIKNPEIMELARRPVYYALLIQLLESGKSSLEGVVDEFSLLKTAVHSEIRRTIDELNNAKDISSSCTEILRQSLLEALLNCAINCTQNNGNEAQIIFSREELNEIIPAGIVSVKNKSVESATQEKPWTFKMNQYNERRVSFLHNIVREFLVANKFFILIDDCVSCKTDEKPFFDMLRSVQMSPASLRFFLIFLQKSEQEEIIKEKLKHWLCTPEIKKDLILSAKLLEILLQPGSKFCGSENAPLNLSGIHADNLCIWNCQLQHVDFKDACLKNMQMTNTKLDDVDLRGADLSGLRLAPSKPIIDICFWNQKSKWHLAVLYQNGQVLRYSFTSSFMQGSYSVKLLPQYEEATSLFSISNTPYIIVSGKTIYPLEGENKSKNELYSMSSGKSIQQIIPQGEDYCIVVRNGNDYRVQVIDEQKLISQFFSITESDLYFLTKDGMLVLVTGNAMKLVSKTGTQKNLNKWENNYECFTVHQQSNDENHIYIKYDKHLIREIYDEKFNSKSMSTDYQIEGTFGTMQKICVLKEDILVGISDSDLYIMTLKTNTVIAEKVNTAVEASRVKLINDDGSKKMKDQDAYELITGSVISNNETVTSTN